MTAFLFDFGCLMLTTIALSAGKMFKLFSTEFLLNEYAYIQTFKKIFSKINFKWTSMSSSFKVDMNLICMLAISVCMQATRKFYAINCVSPVTTSPLYHCADFLISDLHHESHNQIYRVCLQSSQCAGRYSSKVWNQSIKSYQGENFER